jgi:hypothetical protein
MLVNPVVFSVLSFLVSAFAKPIPRSSRSRSLISGRQATNKTWTQADKYQGQDFLEYALKLFTATLLYSDAHSQWEFETFPGGDPTHGYVNYLNQADAISKTLAKVNGQTLMLAVDDFTPLQPGQNRDS